MSKTDKYLKIEGYGIVWGKPDNRDLQHEYFTKDTVLDMDDAYPIVIGGKLFGTAELTRDDIGVKVNAMLHPHIPTSQSIIKFLKEGKMFFVPEGSSHEVDETGKIVSFPISSIGVTSAPVQSPQQRKKAISKGGGDAL